MNNWILNIKNFEETVDAFVRRVNKVCLVTIAVLLYLMSLLAGLYQELGVYIMEVNVAASKTAESIVEDNDVVAETLLNGVEHFKVSAPKGTGNYVAVFNEDEVWVVSEMSTLNSLQYVSLFLILDLATYTITLWVIVRYMSTCKKWVSLLFAYQIVFLMFSWIVNHYSWWVLFEDRFLSPCYTVARIIILSVAFATYNKSVTVQVRIKQMK